MRNWTSYLTSMCVVAIGHPTPSMQLRGIYQSSDHYSCLMGLLFTGVPTAGLPNAGLSAAKGFGGR